MPPCRGGLLGIESLDRVEIEIILDRAKTFQPRQTDSQNIATCCAGA